MPSRRLEVMSPVQQAAHNRLPSTPDMYVSPLSRRHVSIGLASSKKSPGAYLSPSVMMNDDEAEKRERQMNKVLEMQQRNLVSPGTPHERRLSLPLSGLTNAQLTEHYADCIKLSTENKISAKNAFGLHLIDYMSELFKKKEITDFQLASSTLDASAKIYAGRVDAIHSEMYKVLTGLGRGASGLQKQDEKMDEAMEVDEEGNDVAAVTEDGEKKRKRAKRSQTIETNIKNITVSKIEIEFEVNYWLTDRVGV